MFLPWGWICLPEKGGRQRGTDIYTSEKANPPWPYKGNHDAVFALTWKSLTLTKVHLLLFQFGSLEWTWSLCAHLKSPVSCNLICVDTFNAHHRHRQRTALFLNGACFSLWDACPRRRLWWCFVKAPRPEIHNTLNTYLICLFKKAPQSQCNLPRVNIFTEWGLSNIGLHPTYINQTIIYMYTHLHSTIG